MTSSDRQQEEVSGGASPSPSLPQRRPRLLSWPLRLFAFAVLVLIAVVAICVIDRHTMAKQAMLIQHSAQHAFGHAPSRP